MVQHTAAGRRKRGGKRLKSRQTLRRSRQEKPMTAKEQRRTWQVLICGGIFVCLVAAKMLFPEWMEPLGSRAAAVLERNIDVQAVFSALGKSVSGSGNKVVEEVYQAVFGAKGAEELTVVQVGEPHFALERLHAVYEAGEREEQMSVILYSEENLPEDVSMQQAMLGFDCCTPVVGTLTSSFGYREHPIAGEEAFHYGVDLAAAKGTKILSFGDGTIGVVGESSSYGNYCTVNHGNGCTTLYAHCDKILASSGTAVRKGDAIATVGDSGMATGSHLHFELQCEGTYLNPIYYIDCETAV